MRKFSLFLLSALLYMGTAFPQKKTIVYKAGEQGYASYRIPALLTLPDGSILAFSEGRKNNAADFGNVDIVMRRSTDGGRHWGVLQVVADYGDFQAGNPAPLLDRTDPAYPKGRLFLFYNTGKVNEAQMRKGNGVREIWYKISTDGGKNWGAPVNITLEVNRPLKPALNPAYHFREDWRSYANTPGHAMQFLWGQYKGRIYVAANHSAGEPKAHFMDYHAHGYYTDDHGQSFHLSENVPFPGGNEAMAAQLYGDTLMMNLRNQQGNPKTRIVAISSDGGDHWDTTFHDRQLPDPVCQGSILSYKNKKGNVVLLVCNNADTAARNKLTLRISKDLGINWKRSVVIAQNPLPDADYDYSAYSDISLLPSGKIGVLYEENNYKTIIFKAIRIK